MIKNNLDSKVLIYEQFARIGKSISSPKRLELLDILSDGEKTVEILAKKTNMSMSNTSQHLQILKEARLIESEKKGMYVIYRLSDNSVIDFVSALHKVAENRLIEIQHIKNQFLQPANNFEALTHDDFTTRILDGSILLIDVRPVEEYNLKHIKGAISIPLSELEEKIATLPIDKNILAYCRGKYCVMSIKAVEQLRKKGFNANRFEDSVDDWSLKNLPVAIGNNIK